MTTTGRALDTLRAGYGAQQAGNPVRAEQLYRQVLAEEPTSVHALLLLGVLCEQSSRPAEAIEHLRGALAVGGDNVDVHAALGRAYFALEEFRPAIEHLRRASELRPGAAPVLVDLGNALAAARLYKEAIASYEAALKIKPNSAEYWTNLAGAHCDARNPDQGLRAIDCALHLKPDLAQAWTVKADLLVAHGRPAEAIVWYRKYLERHPDDIPTLLNLANAQREANEPQAGIATLQKVLDRDPHDPHAMLIMGRFREQLGELEAAKDCFREVIRVAPYMAEAYHQLAQIRGHRSSDDELAAMRSAWDSPDLSTNDRILIAFGLYRALEQRSCYDEAFDYLETGNRLIAEEMPYDGDAVANWMDAAVAGAEAAIARLGRDAGEPDPRPVFVLGMLRSGTTLTEQILASHSQVAAAGEVGYVEDMQQALREITGTAFPGSVEQLSAAQLRELGRYYVSRHADADLQRRYVVDKRPTNHEDIGLLALALPQARFIHCHRHPVASCFAIYRLPFDPQHSYSHELTALARHYCHYWNLMKRWHALFPGRILDVRYEDTVADVEAQSRRLLEFLGLPFEDGVLRYYATERLVTTPSASQVRQPIYSDALDSWKLYEHRLGPLIENLQPAIREFEQVP